MTGYYLNILFECKKIEWKYDQPRFVSHLKGLPYPKVVSYSDHVYAFSFVSIN